MIDRRSLVLLALLVSGLTAQGPRQVGTIPIRGGVYMLTGRGGNMALCIGEDGAFLVDDQFADMSRSIQEAVAKLTKKPIRFLLNTHWHGDHTGGNEILGKSGAVIVAHENVRRRMETGQVIALLKREIPPAKKAALPVVTFSRDITFHWNDEEVYAFHVDPAHTDGDVVIRFRKADVFHMGDLFFNGAYPFVDESSGGHIDGVIAAATRVMRMAGGESRIIPGHGPLSDRRGLVQYRRMLETVRHRVAALVEEGKSEDETVAARPTKDFDEAWGKGFQSPEVWVRSLWRQLSKRR